MKIKFNWGNAVWHITQKNDDKYNVYFGIFKIMRDNDYFYCIVLYKLIIRFI